MAPTRIFGAHHNFWRLLKSSAHPNLSQRRPRRSGAHQNLWRPPKASAHQNFWRLPKSLAPTKISGAYQNLAPTWYVWRPFKLNVDSAQKSVAYEKTGPTRLRILRTAHQVKSAWLVYGAFQSWLQDIHQCFTEEKARAEQTQRSPNRMRSLET